MLTLHYDSEHEANGYSCFQKLVEGIEDAGVQLFEVMDRDEHGDPTAFGESIMTHGHSAQFRTTAADGEACYNGNGPEKSVKARLHGEHGLGDKTHVVIHDFAHSDDLLIEDAHKVDTYVKDVQEKHKLFNALNEYPCIKKENTGGHTHNVVKVSTL